MKSVTFVVMLLLSVVGIDNTAAADLELTKDQLCSVSLRGPIETGDTAKLLQVLSRHHINKLDQQTFSICLESNGGSFSEGIKFAEAIYKHGLSTVVRSGSDCFSSCAIIFMAGVGPDQLMPLRRLSVGARLGFHAPYLSLPDRQYTKSEAESASQAMRSAILALSKMASSRTRMSGNEFIKKSLIFRIVEKGPTDVFFISNVSEAARWNIELYDAESHFRTSRPIDEMKNACVNFHFSNMDDDIPDGLDYSIEVDSYASKYSNDDFRVLVKDQKTNSNVCEIYPKTFKADKNVALFACSFDHWTSRNFGDCRNYKTELPILVGKHLPTFMKYSPSTRLLQFRN